MPLPEPLNNKNFDSLINYFPKEYSRSISSWVRLFEALNQPKALTLLSLLKERFDIDGCRLSIVELQAILNAYSHATVICRTDDEFLLKLIALCKQNQILDVLLYIRTENILKRCIDNVQGKEILNAIHLIHSPHLKALMATKLHEAPFDESILLQLLTMLRYAVDRFRRLEKMTLKEWIDTSQRQQWSAIGELLKSYGALGYYLAFLDSRGRRKEVMLRNSLKVSSIRARNCKLAL